jgi:hypothetical protein
MTQILERAPDGGARAVDESAELRIATVIVPELVGEDRAQLRHGERLQQRQAEPHDAAGPQAHQAAPMRHPGIHVAHQVDIRGHVLLRRGGDAADHLEQLRVLRRLELGTGRFEAIPPRHDGPEDDGRARETAEGQLGGNAARVVGHRIRHPEKRAR